MPLQGDLAVERMCQLAQVSRARFYRYLQCRWQGEEEVAVRSAVQSVVIEHRWRYGYRRVTAELRAQGVIVNHERVVRVMREDNLLAVRQEWFRPVAHSLPTVRIYVNLASRMTLSGPNQLKARRSNQIVFLHLLCKQGVVRTIRSHPATTSAQVNQLRFWLSREIRKLGPFGSNENRLHLFLRFAGVAGDSGKVRLEL
jgi:HTH-like domain